MLERITSNWTYIRVFYLIMGLIVIIQSVMYQQWFGVAFGSYFASMGLFAFGCASGSCFGNNTKNEATSQTITQEVEYEEIKMK
ncbi:MAG: hypothetical protein HOP11_13360 [Saprospiraceae bacterium]|nr:hypothetical protein [Saprospiraceae bacterium]